MASAPEQDVPQDVPLGYAPQPQTPSRAEPEFRHRSAPAPVYAPAYAAETQAADEEAAGLAAVAAVRPGRWQSIVNWSGGVISLALIAGLIFWGWELMVRDVSGVPVIQALEGPMRVEPEDPGGREADHQGLAVNRIAEGQEAAPAADELVLAPPPVELAALEGGPVNPFPAENLGQPGQGESATARRLAPSTAPDTSPEPRPRALPQVAETQSAEELVQVAAEAPEAEPTPEAASAATLALIDQLIQAENGGTAGNSLIEASEDTGPMANRVLPISVPGVRTSLIPVPRPVSAVASETDVVGADLMEAGLADVTRAAAPDPAPEPVAQEIAFDSLPQGTWLAQLGEYDSADEARAFWQSLKTAFPDYFDDRARVVQQTNAGGATFIRLRAHGFDDLMDTRRFCTALLAEGHNRCIPVAVR
ncbi:MAG: SPOR domain-containing protein [Pseudomonadota bacterium]